MPWGGVDWYGGSFYWGNLVELFFIISGFFAFNSVKRIQQGSSFLAFYAKKYLRFLPMLVICGIACIIAQTLYATIYDPEMALDASMGNIIASLVGVERWLSKAPMVNNPMWYVSVLLLCLAVFFATTRLCLSKGLSLALCYGSIVIAGMLMKALCELYSLSFPFFNAYIARGLICFFLGLAIALAFHQPRIGTIIRNNVLVLIVAILLVIAYILLHTQDSPFSQKGDPVGLYYSLCFILYPCLMVICNHQLTRNATSSKKLAFLGGAAYNMYVWHIALIFVFMTLTTFAGTTFVTAEAMYSFLLLCFAFGWLSSQFLDGPIAAKADLILTSHAEGRDARDHSAAP